MTRYGIVADPHGNEEALVACLVRLDRERVDRIVCLGDLVGFNSRGNECVRRLVTARALAICGNHDLIAIGRLDFSRCADKAIFALEQTRRDLSAWTRLYLGNLPAQRLLGDRILCVHGGLDDPQQYLHTPADIQGTAAALARHFPGVKLLLFAHTHEPKVYEAHDGQVHERDVLPETPLNPVRLSLLNPGAVDASRKPDQGSLPRHAELCIFDSERWSARFLRVPYDHAKNESQAASRGYRITAGATGLYAVRRWLRGASAAAGRRLAWAGFG